MPGSATNETRETPGARLSIQCYDAIQLGKVKDWWIPVFVRLLTLWS